MERRVKKSVYTIGGVILAVLLFVLLFIFDQDKSWNEVSLESSSTTSEDSSSEGGISDSSSVDSGNSEDSSSGGGGGGGGGGNEPTVLFRVKSDMSHYPMYLRENGFGTYTGKGEHGFTGTERYYLDDGEINPLYYFATALEQSGYTRHTAEVELKAFKGDLLPYHPITGTNRAPEQMEYSVDYYAFDYLVNDLSGVSPLSGDYGEQEERYRQTVYRNYLSIDGTLKNTLLDLAAENQIYSYYDKRQIVLQVADYIQNAAYYDYYWAKRNYPSDKDMVTYFLTEEKAGVCRHFAAAATMMFRALGIPARYAIGFAVPVTANEWTEWEDAGHAWTEVYFDGYGWVPLEVTGGNMAPERPDDDLDDSSDEDIFYACEAIADERWRKEMDSRKRQGGERV